MYVLLALGYNNMKVLSPIYVIWAAHKVRHAIFGQF